MKKNNIRAERELWKVIYENFDRFFSDEKDRVNCICDCILVMGFPKYGILSFEERDFMLERMKQIGEQDFGIHRKSFAPFWEYGEREPRKEFLKNKINEQTSKSGKGKTTPTRENKDGKG